MKNKKQVIFYFTVIVLLFLSFINLNKYFTPAKVLGANNSTELINKDDFWKEFLNENPNYIPGYFEIGNLEEVARLDPNFSP